MTTPTAPASTRAGPAARAPLTRVPLYPGPLPRVRPDRLPWPGRVVRSGGVALHIRDTPGPPGGALAVYVHGLGGSATNFTDVAALIGTQLPGMAVDLPGFGRSEPSDGFDYTPDAHAAALGDFLAGLGRGPIHLVANSMGGAVALLLAAARPEIVRTLTLISPAVPDLRVNMRRLSDPRYALAFLPVLGPRVRRRLAAMSPAQRTEQMLRLCFAD
ncbi:MAG: alpha/beta fold hydrolase, partial [Pseudonocardiaceae bacterium]